MNQLQLKFDIGNELRHFQTNMSGWDEDRLSLIVLIQCKLITQCFCLGFVLPDFGEGH